MGEGELTLKQEGFTFIGALKGENTTLDIPIANFPTLPFTPGRHIEIQKGKEIYRCVLKEGQKAQKFINMVKAFFEIKNEITA